MQTSPSAKTPFRQKTKTENKQKNKLSLIVATLYPWICAGSFSSHSQQHPIRFVTETQWGAAFAPPPSPPLGFKSTSTWQMCYDNTQKWAGLHICHRAPRRNWWVGQLDSLPASVGARLPRPKNRKKKESQGYWCHNESMLESWTESGGRARFVG